MTIYYFKKSIERKNAVFGTGKKGYYQSEQSLIKAANKFFEETGYKITKQEEKMIISKTIPDYDFYAVQGWCDGFGNDTYTECCLELIKKLQIMFAILRIKISKLWVNGGIKNILTTGNKDIAQSKMAVLLFN